MADIPQITSGSVTSRATTFTESATNNQQNYSASSANSLYAQSAAALAYPANLQSLRDLVREKQKMVTSRIVQIFIVDPSEAVPLDDRLIYSGEQKFTDLTNQELFYEIDIMSLLDLHNEKRRKIINKDIKDRTEYLDAIRIRDLKMVVTSIAEF